MVVVSDSFTAMQSLLRETDLLAPLPLRLIDKERPRKAVFSQIVIKEPLRPVRVALVTRSDVPLTPAAQALVAQVRRAARLLVGRRQFGANR